MAIFDHGVKNGIQLGKVGDRCVECERRRKQKQQENDEYYDPVDLDYKEVFKIWVNNISHCLCLDCFKEALGKYILVDPVELEKEKEEKPKAKKNTKKKEEKKDESEASEPGEGK